MALSTTETIGLCDQFSQLLETYKAELRTNGLDVTDWITDTGVRKTSVITL